MQYIYKTFHHVHTSPGLTDHGLFNIYNSNMKKKITIKTEDQAFDNIKDIGVWTEYSNHVNLLIFCFNSQTKI